MHPSHVIPFWQRWTPPLLIAGVIFLLSSIPQLKSDFSPQWDFILRKLAHATEYALLAFFVARAVNGGHQSHHPWVVLLGAWLVATLYAMTDEWHQSFVPGREPTVTDVVLDSSGALLGALAAWRVYLRPTTKQSAEKRPVQ
jgi:VanZ family protein